MIEPSASSGVLGTLGIDWHLLIAQLVNVSIVLIAVRWLFKKLVPVMEERTRKIAEGLENAEHAKQLRRESEQEHEQRIAEAKREAKAILVAASEEAEGAKAKKLIALKQELEKITNDAKEQIRTDREAAFASLKQDVAKLVLAGMEQLSVNVSEKDRKQLLQKGIVDVNQ